jgi:hypothetical protein
MARWPNGRKGQTDRLTDIQTNKKPVLKVALLSYYTFIQAHRQRWPDGQIEEMDRQAV